MDSLLVYENTKWLVREAGLTAIFAFAFLMFIIGFLHLAFVRQNKIYIVLAILSCLGFFHSVFKTFFFLSENFYHNGELSRLSYMLGEWILIFVVPISVFLFSRFLPKDKIISRINFILGIASFVFVIPISILFWLNKSFYYISLEELKKFVEGSFYRYEYTAGIGMSLTIGLAFFISIYFIVAMLVRRRVRLLLRPIYIGLFIVVLSAIDTYLPYYAGVRLFPLPSNAQFSFTFGYALFIFIFGVSHFMSLINRFRNMEITYNRLRGTQSRLREVTQSVFLNEHIDIEIENRIYESDLLGKYISFINSLQHRSKINTVSEICDFFCVELRKKYEISKAVLTLSDKSGNMAVVSHTITKPLSSVIERMLGGQLVGMSVGHPRSPLHKVYKDNKTAVFQEEAVLPTLKEMVSPEDTVVRLILFKIYDIVGSPKNLYLFPISTGGEVYGIVIAAVDNEIDEAKKTVLEASASVLARIIKQKESELALQNSEKKYRLLFESEINAIIIGNIENGNIVDVNESACSLYGYSKKEFFTLSLDNIVSLSHDSESRYTEKIRVDESGFVNTYHKKKNGEVFAVSVSARTFEWDNSPMICLIVNNTSAKKAMLNAVSLQRDIVLSLGATSSLSSAFEAILSAVMTLDSIDCAAIYLYTQDGNLEMKYHYNLSDEFKNALRFVPKTSYNAEIVRFGEPVYWDKDICDELKTHVKEGITSVGVLPIMNRNTPVAAITVAGKGALSIPEETRFALEAIALQTAGIIGHLSAEENLRSSRAKLQSIFNSIDDFIFIFDDLGRIIEVNDSVRKRFGYSQSEIERLSIIDLHVPRFRHEAARVFNAIIAGKSKTSSVPMYTKSSEEIPVETRVDLGHWDEHVFYIAIARDISGRIEASEQLKKQEAHLRSIYDAALGVAFILIDVSSIPIITDFSPGASRIFGYSFGEAIGMGAENLHTPEEREATILSLYSIRHQDKGFTEEMRMLRKTGEVFSAMVSFYPMVTSTKGTTVLAVMLDVSKMKDAEEQLIYRDKILQAVSMASDKFLRQPFSEVDVEEILKTLGLAVNADRAYIFQNSEEDGRLFATQIYEWSAPYVEPQIDKVELKHTPYSKASLSRWKGFFEQNLVVCGNISDFPPEEYKILHSQSIVSIIVAPIYAGKNWWGFIGFDECKIEREWTKTEIELLSTAAEIFGAAIRNETMQRIRRENAEEISKSRLRYRAIVEDQTELIFRAKWDGTITFVNDAFCRFNGVKREDIMGTAYKPPVDENQIEEMLEQIRKIEGTNEAIDIEHTILTPHGKRWLQWRVRSITPETGDSECQGVGRDITEQKQAEEILRQEEKRKQQEQLVQMDKMVSLGTLAAGMAHEINNPNNFIMLNSSYLRDAWDDILPILEEYAREHGDFSVGNISFSEMKNDSLALFNGILTGSQRIKKIVEDLKRFSRKDPARLLEVASINSIINSALELLKNSISKSSIELILSLSDDIPFIRCNTQRIEQVLINLIQNSIQATKGKNKSIEITSAFNESDSSILVTVRDEGEGIDASTMSQMLDPFFTTKREEGGTGLGLAVSYNIVREHKGELTFESEVGKGTLATLKLPSNIREEE